MANLYSEVWAPPQSGLFECALCGQEAFQNGCSIRIRDDQGDWHEICLACADEGPAGAAQRMLARAARLRELAERERSRLQKEAEACERLANLLPSASPWVTTADFDAVSDTIRRGSRKSKREP
jgi:hypothetical protein